MADFKLSANIEVRKQAPLDDRLAKMTKADLIKPESWASDNGTYYVYNYMLVGTSEGLFMLVDKAKLLSSDYSGWKRIGNDDTPTGGLSESEVKELIDQALGIALADYVKKVDGKGLSTNDYTNEDKTKLDELNNYDDTTIKEQIQGLQNSLNTLVGGNASSAIESFNEIVAFLASIEDTQTLSGIINGINQAIAAVEAKIPDLSEYVTETELEERLAEFKPSGDSEGVEELKASKASHIAVKDMVAYLFPSQEAKDAFLNNGEATYLDSASFDLVDKVIEMVNVSGNNNPFFTSDQQKAEIAISWRSLVKPITSENYTEVFEDAIFSVDVDRGNTGSWQTIETRTVMNGEVFVVDVKKYLAIGANRIVINATGATSKAAGQLNITANLTSMYIKPANFTWYEPIIEGKPYNFGGFEIGGSLSKVLHIKISGHGYTKTYDIDLGTNQNITTAYYFDGIEFPSSGTGVYDVEVWLDAQGLESTHLLYEMMFVSAEDENSAQMVVVSNVAKKAVNYTDNTLFEFATYNGNSTTSNPSITLTANVKGSDVVLVDEVMSNVPTKSAQPYIAALEIESDEESMSLISELTLGNTKTLTYEVDNSLSFPASSGAVFYMNTASRTNSQENREKIINAVNGQEINAAWTNVAFVDGVDGHTIDDNGRKCLFLPARTKLIIDYTPMASVGNGKSIEFCYKVKNVSDYNEPIITICDDPTSPTFKGLVIKPTNILLHSRDLTASNLTQGIDVNEEEEIHMVATLIKNYKVTYGNLAQIFVNGSGARSFEFSGSDSWVNSGKIILGSDTADLYVYVSRVYDRGFEKLDSEKNYVASLVDVLTKQSIRDWINSVRDDRGNISFDKCKGNYNTMLIRMREDAELPHYGLSKEYNAYCDVTFSFVDLPSEYKNKVWEFILENVRIEGQGTTSMNYYLWNLRFRIDKSKNVIIVYLNGEEVGTINI